MSVEDSAPIQFADATQSILLRLLNQHARMDERMERIHTDLKQHFIDEDQRVREQHSRLESLEDSVRDIYTTAKLSRWLISTAIVTVGVIVTAWTWVHDKVAFK